MAFILESQKPSETRAFGQLVGRIINQLGETRNRAFIISLEGPLGSGKTEWLRGFIRYFAPKEQVLSPTFILMREIPLNHSFFKKIYHLDCYRFKNEKEIEVLGFKDIIRQPKNLVVIEWGDRLKKILPSGIWRLKFKHQGLKKRKITLEII